MASSTTTVRSGSAPRSLAAAKNVSGAGFPLRRCAEIVLPSTRTSKNASSLAARKTVSQFRLEVATAILKPWWRRWRMSSTLPS